MGTDHSSLEKLALEQIVGQTIVDAWPAVVHHLLASRETWEETETLESIFDELMLGSLQLWTLLDARRIVKMVIMTRINEYARGKALAIVWGHGEDAALSVHSIDWMENLAQASGCFRLEVYMGRSGWTRLLKKFGYKEVYRVVGRTLDPTMRKDH